MKLNVLERLLLLNILPHEGDFTTLKIVRKLREDLSFSEEEHVALEFKNDNEQVKWNSDSHVIKEVDLGKKAEDLIKVHLEKLNAEKKLTENYFELYEIFVGE
jgi:hypothetical protein